jgi:predicted phosphohydrolase
MHIWAIADLHLSFGVPNKGMDIFGPSWQRHAERVAENWKQVVDDDDLVLLPGDISWATYLGDALADLEWIANLPGKKVMIRGNHDYWWSSPAKIRNSLPPSISIIQNDAILWNDIAIGGTRLWDCKEVNFPNEIIFTKNPAISAAPRDSDKVKSETEKIYLRELNRLELSLKALDSSAKERIIMTHYPPVNSRMDPTKASDLLEKYKVDACIFGHLHSVREDLPLFGEKNGIRYSLTSCDYLHCKLLHVLEVT